MPRPSTMSKRDPAVRRPGKGRIHLGPRLSTVRTTRQHNRSHKEQSVGTQVFINLPVADLPKSVAFYEALGYTRNPQFSNDDGACIVVSDTIFVMLLTHAKFRVFTPKAICDTNQAVEVLLKLSHDR